jgi:hypothetical protein
LTKPFALLQDPGLSPDTIFFTLFFDQLATNLKDDTALLKSIQNADLIVNTNSVGEQHCCNEFS